MPNPRNRRDADARDANGNRTGDDRPTAGEADPATRSRMLSQALGESSPAPAAAPTPAATPAPDDGSGTGGRQRSAAIMNTVDEMAK